MNKSVIFKKWYLSYLFFLLIISLFVMAMFYLFNNKMKNDLIILNQSHVEEIKTMFDEKLNSLNTISNSISITPEFQKLFNAQEPLNNLDQYNIKEAQKTLTLYDSVSDITYGTSVYLHKPKLFFSSGSVYPDRYFEIAATSKFNSSAKEFREILLDSYNKTILNFKDLLEGGKDTLVYLQSLPIQTIDYPNATVLIELDKSILDSYFSNDSYGQNISFIILDDNNRVIYNYGNLPLVQDLDYNHFLSKPNHDLKINNLAHTAITIKSDINNWLYIKCIPKNIYNSSVTKLRNKILFLITTLLIIGTIIAYILAKRNYTPLGNITNQMSKNNTLDIKNNNNNEFDMIKNHIKLWKEKNLELQTEIDKQNMLLKRNFLRSLLKGKIYGPKEIEKQLENFDLQFNYNRLCVIAFRIDQISLDSKKDSEGQNYTLSCFIIQNLFEEIIPKYLSIYPTEDESLILYIINYDSNRISNSLEYVNTFESIISETITNAKNSFNIDITASMSNHHSEIESLSDAYRECLDALTYANLIGHTQIIFYEDTLQSKAVYDYPIDKEQRLINLIKSGNLEESKKLINSLIKIHQNRSDLSTSSILFLFYDILGTIMKTVTASKEQELVNKLEPLKNLLSCTTLSEMNMILEDFLEKMCKIKTETVIIQGSELISSVHEYIINNLSNSDLNVAMVGNHFDITPAYLSKLYRTEKDESILMLINRLRIKESKKLLKETDLSMKEIASSVGYLYPNTYIRIFKKYEGFTPGQYRKTLDD